MQRGGYQSDYYFPKLQQRLSLWQHRVKTNMTTFSLNDSRKDPYVVSSLSDALDEFVLNCMYTLARSYSWWRSWSQQTSVRNLLLLGNRSINIVMTRKRQALVWTYNNIDQLCIKCQATPPDINERIAVCETHFYYKCKFSNQIQRHSFEEKKHLTTENHWDLKVPIFIKVDKI